ncbi:MAG: transketolase [Candidatus Neomarinimicrobiota bacterium]
MMNQLERLCINTLRFLAVDAVEAAKSGHPGMPLGVAPAAYILWDRFRRHSPSNPQWFNRDRFVLSAGHGCALLYALLHLTGYDLSLEDIKRFRQWGSKTPGHPEYGSAPGVESTTGPLGQGFANGVGMAMAERFLANRYNRKGYPVVDHYTYAIVSDGDLMEGVSSEAASLAGLWGLGKIIYLHDDNHVTIEGSTDLAFTEDVHQRFESYGWHVQKVADGNDLQSIAGAIENAQEEVNRPSLVMIRTHIGFGSPKQDSASAHGEPLGPESSVKTKETLGWPLEPTFYIPEEAEKHFREALARGTRQESEWERLVEEYSGTYPDLAVNFRRIRRGELPPGWGDEVPEFRPEDGPIATRTASGKVLNVLAKHLDNLLGGSADLAPSNKTLLAAQDDFGLNGRWGPNVHFGVREHAMGAILNGVALHGGVLPYGGTFLVFSDYMRPALRLGALSRYKVIFIFTHDSIGLGEDGPTHQPVEHLMSLRAIPNFTVIRPADANETASAWKLAVEQDGPVALILTRQKIPVLDSTSHAVADGVRRGAYVLSEAKRADPHIVIIATGSEVHTALEAQRELSGQGIEARVVSMPSWELFEKQPVEYRHEVLPSRIPKLAVEAGSPLGWHKYVGETGVVIGLERFGASAPGSVVLENLGFSGSEVASRARALLEKTEKLSAS